MGWDVDVLRNRRRKKSEVKRRGPGLVGVDEVVLEVACLPARCSLLAIHLLHETRARSFYFSWCFFFPPPPFSASPSGAPAAAAAPPPVCRKWVRASAGPIEREWPSGREREGSSDNGGGGRCRESEKKRARLFC